MTLLRDIFPAVVLFLLLLTGCESDQPKKTATFPRRPTLLTLLLPKPKRRPPPRPRPAPPQTTPSKTTADPAEALIAQAEKQYAAGQANYQAGHLEAAKANFDQAFNTLLGSNLDVRNDERLQREFDKIVEAVHELEMLALQQGDGFTEQRSEPAPIDEANDITFPVDPNIKAKAEAEIKTTKSDLPLVLNDQVAMYINYFSSPRGQRHAGARLGALGRYNDMISRSSERGRRSAGSDLPGAGGIGLPAAGAVARGSARHVAVHGRVGRVYGLERNWWVDERQDPEKATRAAARHLKDLYNQFGDWYLAMAAYNSGAGTVQRAVERTGYADFWELYRRGVLPQETRNYVPIILAMTIMAKNPEQYGLEHVALEPAPQLDQVTINYPVDLRLVAECVDTSVDTCRS